MSYADETINMEGLDGIPDFMLLREGVPHISVKPDWNGGTVMGFRPFQAVENGQLIPIREDHRKNNFGPQVKGVRLVQAFGANARLTYVTNLIGPDGKMQGSGVMNPTRRFCRGIHDAVNANPDMMPDWRQWTTKDNKGPKDFTLPKDVDVCMLLQGAITMEKGELLVDAGGRPKPKFPCVLIGTVSLRMSIEDLANKRREDFTGPDDDYDNAYVLGNPFHPDHGRVLRIFRSKGDSRFEREHYEVQIAEEYPIPLQVLAANFVPWENLLKFSTEQEQIGYLCRAFTPEAVDYVFGKTELADSVPNHVRGSFDRAMQARQQQQQYQQPPSPHGQQPSQAPPPPQAPPPQEPPSQAPPPQQADGPDWGNAGQARPPAPAPTAGSAAAADNYTSRLGGPPPAPAPIQPAAPAPAPAALPPVNTQPDWGGQSVAPASGQPPAGPAPDADAAEHDEAIRRLNEARSKASQQTPPEQPQG